MTDLLTMQLSAVNFENSLTMRAVFNRDSLLKKIRIYLPEGFHADYAWGPGRRFLGSALEEADPEFIEIYNGEKTIFSIYLSAFWNFDARAFDEAFNEKFLPFFKDKLLKDPDELERVFNWSDLAQALEKKLPDGIRLNKDNFNIDKKLTYVDLINDYTNVPIMSIPFVCEGGYNFYEVKAFVKNVLDTLGGGKEKMIEKKRKMLERF